MASIRIRVPLLILSVLALLASAVGSGPALATSGDWKTTIAGLVDDPYAVHSVAYKQRMGAALPANLTDDLGDRRVASVLTDTRSRYVDTVRFRSDADGRAAYGNDLHLAAWLAARLASGGSNPELTGLSDLLMAGRLSADTAIQDAEAALRAPDGTTPSVTISEAEEPERVKDLRDGDDLLAEAGTVTTPGGVEAATRELDLARRDYAKAQKSWGKSLPVTTITHLGLAWRHAYNVLAHLGITYDGDYDQDGVLDRSELMLGSSPLRTDTDGDGLTDLFEIDKLLTYSLPAQSDTDTDAIKDGAEDLDGDSLTALAEQQFGSSPTEPDTDFDGSDDAAERAAGTNPTKADSDVDGLLDGVEPFTGTDVRDSDSDDDGVLDGDEVLRQQVQGPDGITATLLGQGDLVSSFQAAKATGDQRLAGPGGQVGPAYDFSLSPPANQRLQQAELTIPYDTSALNGASPENLRLFYFDPERNFWIPATLEQSVDTTRNTVTATVTHFSTYAIFDIKNWGETWSAQDNPCRTRSDGGTDIVFLDLALVMDSSGSMSWNDPDGLRLTAAKSFVDALLPEDRAGVVDFDSSARVTQSLTTDHDAVKAAIDRVNDSGGTNLSSGVSLGNQMLIDNGDPTRARMAILLTDGVGSYNSQLTTQAKANGITIYTIALGTDTDTALLKSIATETGGKFHQVNTAAELPEVFRRISDDTSGDPRAAVDTDGDGLNDCVEIEGAMGGNGVTYTSDPSLVDTDGDGLSDGDEVGDKVDGDSYLEDWQQLLLQPIPGLVFYDVVSDPRAVDSDGDDLDDPNELDLGTEARDSTTDSDGLTDGYEVDAIGTAPDNPDTDGDGLWDDTEDAHRDDQGLDPLHADVKISTWSYSVDFAKGLILGDLNREDSLAWLAGNLASGAASFIPVYGWIVGGIADLRDAIGSAIRADWVGSGLSALGVVPYAGDAVAIPGKAAKFVVRNPELADESLSFIAKLEDVPNDIKVKAAKEILGGSWDDLIKAGFSEATLTTLQKGRTNLDELADSLSRAKHVKGASARFFAKGKDGEAWLEGAYSATVKGTDKQVWRSTKNFLGRGRFFDVFKDGVAHESKVGYVKWGKSIENQIKKDAWLVQQASNGVDSAQWHFFASSASNTIGADKRVLDLLDQNNIPYTIHTP